MLCGGPSLRWHWQEQQVTSFKTEEQLASPACLASLGRVRPGHTVYLRTLVPAATIWCLLQLSRSVSSTKQLGMLSIKKQNQ